MFAFVGFVVNYQPEEENSEAIAVNIAIALEKSIFALTGEKATWEVREFGKGANQPDFFIAGQIEFETVLMAEAEENGNVDAALALEELLDKLFLDINESTLSILQLHALRSQRVRAIWKEGFGEVREAKGFANSRPC